jgi:glutathione S-transferase
MVLNYKGVRYTQTFISYPDIAPLLKKLEVPPNSKGMPYTLPGIVHKSSVTANPFGAMIDSFPIALHLEQAFPAPSYPTIFPSGDSSYPLARAVEYTVGNLINKSYMIIMPRVADKLDERGSKYFHETRTVRFGKPLPELLPKNQQEYDAIWKEMEKELETWSIMLKGKPGKKGPFFEGEKLGYADIVAVSYLAWFERMEKGTFDKMLKVGDGELKALWDASVQWADGQGEEKEWPVSS